MASLVLAFKTPGGPWATLGHRPRRPSHGSRARDAFGNGEVMLGASRAGLDGCNGRLGGRRAEEALRRSAAQEGGDGKEEQWLRRGRLPVSKGSNRRGKKIFRTIIVPWRIWSHSWLVMPCRSVYMKQGLLPIGGNVLLSRRVF
jgi:hypothetical protein